VKALEAAMGEDLKRIDWMDDETRARATAKLDAIVNKIGFPDRWVDRSKIVVTRSSWIENARTAARFEHDREVAKIGKPYDRMEWRMTPPTVNASYNPSVNQITFPAGILQPPFFDKRLDDATNYGAIGGVIGHEITHGFDDQGSQFDKDGNLKNWWTERSAKEFARRAGCVAQQFDSYAVDKDLHVNGKLTLGENIGDLGGLKIAFAAMKKATAGNEKTIGGMSDDQRFFLAWAQGWCRNITPEEARLRVRTDPHAPGDMRVKGPFSNLSEFRSAFHCEADSPMVRKPEETCEVW
jgi:putative endopeptidase